jgi:fibronectin-binding autotransporter adhesin
MILAESNLARVGNNIVRAISSSTATLREFFVFTDIVLSSVISGNVGLVKNGTGILTLSNTSNSYSGNASVNTGVLVITDIATLPGWNVNGRYSVQSGATLAVYNAVTDANVTTILGTTNFNAGSAIGFDTTSGNRTYPNAVVNTAKGALGLTKLGSNILTISSNVNTYTGPTLVIAGTLATSAGNRIPDASPVTILSGATIILGGSEVLATIAGSGTLNCQGNNIALSSNNNSTFSGTLTSTANSGNCIYKTGTNIITLSGATVSVVGPIRMDTGGMTLVGNTSFVQNKTSGSPRDFQLALNAVNTFILTIGNGASLTTAGVMFGENNGGSATVNLLSGGAWNSGSGGGQSWMSGLSSIFNIDGGAYSAGLFYIGGGFVAQNTTSIINLNSGSFSLTNSLIWQGAGICVFNLNGGTATFANFGQSALTDNTFNFNGGTFATQNGNYSYNYSNVKYRVKSGGAIFNIPSGYTAAFNTSPLITDSVSTGGGLVKNGAGILSLGSEANTFTGQVFINEGTISVTTVNNNSTNGPFGNSAFAIVLGSSGKTGVLQYTTASNLTTTRNFILPLGAIGGFDITGATNVGLEIAGIISGSGSLVKTGQGVLTYSGNNTYTGSTTLIQGINIVGSDTAFGTGTLNLNGGSLSAHTVAPRTLSNNIIINTATTFNTTVSEKSLTLTGSITITGLIQLAVATGTNVPTQPLIISGPIGDGGNNYQINKSGAGILVLTGQNTFGGSLVLQAGNTRILYPTIGDIRTTAGIIQFAPGITTDLSSSIRNNTQSVKIDTNGQNVTFVSLSSSNTGGLLKTGTGILIISGSGNTYTGTNTVSAGELTFSGTYTATNDVKINGSADPILNISGNFTQTFTGSSVRSFQLASSPGTTATVNVSGSAVVTLNGGMMLGDNSGGNGTFNQTGGTVSTSSSGTWLSGAVCLLNVSGGTFATAGIECGGGIGAGVVTVSGTGTINAGTLFMCRGSGTGISGVININGGTLTLTGISHITTSRPATINFNGGIFSSLNTLSIPSTVTCIVKSGGITLNVSGQLNVQSVLATDGTNGGLVKLGAGTLALGSMAHTYTGSTTISAGAITVSKTTNSITGTATYTTTSLTVNFSNVTPNSGSTYRFFPGSTATTGLTISLINAGGKTGSYDYANSTLTIN